MLYLFKSTNITKKVKRMNDLIEVKTFLKKIEKALVTITCNKPSTRVVNKAWQRKDGTWWTHDPKTGKVVPHKPKSREETGSAYDPKTGTVRDKSKIDYTPEKTPMGSGGKYTPKEKPEFAYNPKTGRVEEKKPTPKDEKSPAGDKPKPPTGGVLSPKHPDYDPKRNPIDNVSLDYKSDAENKAFYDHLKKKVGYSDVQIANLKSDTITALSDKFDKRG